jgi:cbb3-type cytochrome oxidase subunit 1
MDELRALTAAAYFRCDLRLRRQRPDRELVLCRAAHQPRAARRPLSPWFVFWGYQLFIVLAATGYLFGVTQSKEYAEPEWYVDIWLTIVWVVYFLVFVGTLARRREPHIYVANWFYLAFIVTIAMLHIINNLAVPVSFLGAAYRALEDDPPDDPASPPAATRRKGDLET